MNEITALMSDSLTAELGEALPWPCVYLDGMRDPTESDLIRVPLPLNFTSGSVPGAGTRHAVQDRDTDQDDNHDHHVYVTHSRDNKSPRYAADDKSKTDQISESPPAKPEALKKP